VPTRLDCLVIDANDPARLAAFWAEALGWPITDEDPEEVVVGPSGEHGDEDPASAGVPLLFGKIDEPKTVQNRIHLDLGTTSPEHQVATVARLTALGAQPIDVGQGDGVPWVVLADIEGNELCVLEPRDAYAGTGPVAAIVLHCADPGALAPFWAAATGWVVASTGERSATLRRPDGRGPHLELVRSPGPKTVKNRVHPDVAPFPEDDQRAEVARLEALGARRVDIGQGDGVPWVVLGDPEGNELCVLTPR
jgi:hypothetical protein